MSSYYFQFEYILLLLSRCNDRIVNGTYNENVQEAFLETGKIEFENFSMVEIFIFTSCQNYII